MSDFSTSVKNIISTVAPVLGTALGGPLGGLAGGLLSKALGSPDISGHTVPATQKQIESAILGGDPQTLLALKQVEADLQKHMADLGVQEDQLAYADRADARAREVGVKDWTPRILAAIVVGGWIVVQMYLLRHVIEPTMRELIFRVLGTLDSALMLVLSYYFGSSSSSQQKTDGMLAAIKGKS